MRRADGERWNIRMLASLLGGLALLLVLGCAGSELEQHKDTPTIAPIPERPVQNTGGPLTAPFAPQGEKVAAPPVQSTDVAGVWAVTCQPAIAGCPAFEVTLSAGGDITDMDGHGPSSGHGQIRDGRLALSIEGVGAFEGGLDASGNRAAGTVRGGRGSDAKPAVAVRKHALASSQLASGGKECFAYQGRCVSGTWLFEYRCPDESQWLGHFQIVFDEDGNIGRWEYGSYKGKANGYGFIGYHRPNFQLVTFENTTMVHVHLWVKTDDLPDVFAREVVEFHGFLPADQRDGTRIGTLVEGQLGGIGANAEWIILKAKAKKVQ